MLSRHGVRAWLRDHSSSLSLSAACIALTAALALQAHRLDAQRYAEQFRRDAGLWGERVVAPVQAGLIATRAAARRVAAGPLGDPDVAGLLAAAELRPTGTVDAAGWFPVPPEDGSPAGFGFQVFSAPVLGLGATVQSPGIWNPAVRSQLRRAARSGTPTLVWLPPDALPQLDGLLIAVPVATVYGGLQQPGIAFGVIGAARLTGALREEEEGCPLVVELHDPGVPGGAVHRMEPAAPRPRWLGALLAEGWRAPGVFTSAGEGWWVQLSPTPAYRAEHTSGAHWSIALIGALLTGALVHVQYRIVRPTRARLRQVLAERAQREQAEGALRESRAMLQLVLDAIPVRVHWKDTRSVYQGCNRRFAEDAELASPAEIVGKTDRELPWARYADLYRAKDREVLESGRPLPPYEQPRSTSAGELRWLLQSKVPLRDGQGTVIGVLTVYEDVTDRREGAEQLAASERKYRELVQHANSAIVRISPQGQITFINEFGQRFFGWSEAELLGRPAVEFLGSTNLSARRDLTSLLETLRAAPGAPVQRLTEIACKDGRHVWVAWTNKAVFGEDGALAGVFCVGSDVTEQRAAEEALRRARDELEVRVEERTAELSRANEALTEENEMHLRAVAEIRRLNADLEARAAELAAANERLTELDRLKSEFLATMSHELRTPLNSIIGFTGIVAAGMAGPLTDEQAKQLGMVRGSATHLLTLINDLLDLSRIEAGRIELERRVYDLKAVVAEVEASCRPALGAKGLAFRTELPEGPLALTGDRKRCFQVLLNLASNAVKFTERGEVRVSAAEEGARVRITVADTGIGIRPEHLGMLFEAFRQVDGSARRVYEGTGLGLYLCRKLLGLMGGEIGVESVFGQGSRFSFTLPRDAPAEAQPEVRA
jgi:PAS domain S-box-containing protein